MQRRIGWLGRSGNRVEEMCKWCGCNHLLPGVMVFLSLPPLARYSAVSGFSKTVLETNDLAGQRELVAECLEGEVSQ